METIDWLIIISSSIKLTFRHRTPMKPNQSMFSRIYFNVQYLLCLNSIRLGIPQLEKPNSYHG